MTLPTGIGDDVFELWLANGGGFFDSGFDLTGGIPFELLTQGLVNGLTEFQIRRIETSAGLDPAHSLAFVICVTFIGDGTVTGIMTPRQATVPEPGTLAPFGIALTPLSSSRPRRLQ